MPVINPQDNPMAFMSFLAESDWTKTVMTFPAEMGWSEAKAIITEELDKQLEGQFAVLLGDESKLTDDSAEFIIRTWQLEDFAKVSAFAFNFKIQY